MTLLQLQKRINDIVQSNNERGWTERNNMPVCVGLVLDRKRHKTRYYPVESVSSAQVGLWQTQYCGQINIREEDEVKG